MSVPLVFRARAWSNVDGLKVHISLYDKAETCCRIEQRISYLDLVGGDDQPLSVFMEWLPEYHAQVVCKTCLRHALAAFHAAARDAVLARLNEQAGVA